MGQPHKKCIGEHKGRGWKEHADVVCTSEVVFASMENVCMTTTCLCDSYSSISLYL